MYDSAYICECTALMSPSRAKQPYMQTGYSHFTVAGNTLIWHCTYVIQPFGQCNCVYIYIRTQCHAQSVNQLEVSLQCSVDKGVQCFSLT